MGAAFSVSFNAGINGRQASANNARAFSLSEHKSASVRSRQGLQLRNEINRSRSASGLSLSHLF
jgi:hypothetical protein